MSAVWAVYTSNMVELGAVPLIAQPPRRSVWMMVPGIFSVWPEIMTSAIGILATSLRKPRLAFRMDSWGGNWKGTISDKLDRNGFCVLHLEIKELEAQLMQVIMRHHSVDDTVSNVTKHKPVKGCGPVRVFWVGRKVTINHK